MLKYELAQLKFKELRGQIEIPRFQRGLVWGDDKKTEFIRTLKAGLPIGVLLLSKAANGKYHVIDGLQRFSTMVDYANDYFKYVDSSEITDTSIVSIILASDCACHFYDAFPDKQKEAFRESIRKIIVKNIREGRNKNLNQISKTICQQLCSDLKEFHKDDAWNIMDPIFVIVNTFSEESKIDDIELPLIIFKGKDNEELATVFQKLNQEGVKLSKYDVFAATWINDTVTVHGDSDFIRLIIKKYEHAQEKSSLDIANYDPEEMLKTGELTVFEYAFALGKELTEKCDILFNTKKDDSKVESIGFLLLAELLGISYQDMANLAKEIKKHKNLDFRKLKNAIIETTKMIQSTLDSFIIAPTKKKNSLACHSELQLASYIVILFKLRYNISIEEGLTERGNKATKEIKEFKRFLHRHYLYDILRGYWAGSGNTKLEAIIDDYNTNPAVCRYFKDVDSVSFEQVVHEWLTAANKKTKLANVTADAKLFLNYLLRTSVNPAQVAKSEYDIEHCVPQKVLQDHFIKQNKAVPVSAPCNLIYIPKAENRGKGDMTYYQKQKKDASTYTLNADALDELAYPLPQELAFVNSTDTITVQNYQAFLTEREKFITHRFITNLYK